MSNSTNDHFLSLPLDDDFVLTDAEKQAIRDACIDDSTKIIQYLEKSQKKQKRYNSLVFIVTLLGAIGSIIAAITGIILLF
jgi:hypothetical protein